MLPDNGLYGAVACRSGVPLNAGSRDWHAFSSWGLWASALASLTWIRSWLIWKMRLWELLLYSFHYILLSRVVRDQWFVPLDWTRATTRAFLLSWTNFSNSCSAWVDGFGATLGSCTPSVFLGIWRRQVEEYCFSVTFLVPKRKQLASLVWIGQLS